MKPLKRASQQNFPVNTEYYLEKDIKQMEELGIITNLGKMLERPYTEYVVFADDIKRIKVILDDYGSYTNVVVLKDDTQVFIKLD